MTKKISELFNFEQKIVVISGCTGQLGSELADFFIKNKAVVYGIDLKKPSNKKIKFLRCNIINDKKLEDIIKKIYLKEKSINIFVNNAAISVFQNFQKRSLKNFKDIF